jgi:hypothetical protein
MRKLLVIFLLCAFPAWLRPTASGPSIPLRSAITSLIGCMKSMERVIQHSVKAYALPDTEIS